MSNTTKERFGLSWENRVLNRDGYLGIYDVYYRNDNLQTCTENPIAVTGKTIKELREKLQDMLEALDKPVLNYDDF